MITKTLEKHDSFLQRVFEIMPGLLIWIILFSPFWAGNAFPIALADMLIVLSTYWLFRGALTSIGLALGQRQYAKAMKEDWMQKCHDLAEYDLPSPDTLPTGQFLPKHLIVYPVGGAQYDILKRTLDALRKQTYPIELVYISISLEERLIAKNPEYYARMEEQIKEEFAEYGDRLMIFHHPDHIPGEVVGAAANRTWGARNAIEELESRGEIISDFLMTSPDEDITFDPQYLAAATYKFLTTPKREKRFYQTAVYTFNNNYWDVPILVRTLAITVTIPVLSSSIYERYKRETFSCYTVKLDLMKAVGYWDVHLGIDDTTFYWKPYDYYNGDWECEVFYIPLAADAIYDPSYVKTHRDQYKQYLRWGWGVISFPIGMKVLLKNPRIPFAERLRRFIHLFEVFVFFKVLAFMLTFAVPIVLFLNPQLDELVIWYSLPATISQIMSITVIFLIPTTYYKLKIIPRYPEHWSKLRYYTIILIEIPLNIVVLLTYSFLPFIEATTRMMLGQKSAKSVSWTDSKKTTIA